MRIKNFYILKGKLVFDKTWQKKNGISMRRKHFKAKGRL